jgi:hypothetical protein
MIKFPIKCTIEITVFRIELNDWEDDNDKWEKVKEEILINKRGNSPNVIHHDSFS